MKNLQCRIKQEATISKLIMCNGEFTFLENSQPILPKASLWQRDGFVSHDIQVVAIGKSGYGKSTTLNTLIGESVFKTDDTQGCTREMQSSEYRLNTTDDNPCYFSITDMPGLGENPTLDKEYIKLYRDALAKSQVVIYFLKADQRDFTIDKWAFSKLFKTAKERKKVIFALNAIDKIEPINRIYPFTPSENQCKNISKKIKDIATQFKVDERSIVGFSALEKYNMIGLMDKIKGAVEPLIKPYVQ